MAFTKTLFLSLLAVLSVNTIAIAPIHAVGVGETWNHYPPTSNAQWAAITFGNGRFVAVANTGSSHVMVSVVPVIESGPPPPPWLQSYALSGGRNQLYGRLVSKLGAMAQQTIQVGSCAIGLFIGAAGLRLGLKNLASSPVTHALMPRMAYRCGVKRFLTGLISATLIVVPLSSANAIPEVTLNPRVVHGVEGKPGTFPYLAALLETRELQQKGAFRSQFCGATLTSSTTLVTAAHCVVDQKTGERSSAANITAGFTRSLDSENIRLVGVSKVSVHPDYDIETSRNDIAVLTLASAVTDIPPLQPLTPEFAAEYTASGGATQVAGWGNLAASGNKYPAVFRVGDLTIFPDASCAGGKRNEIDGITFSGFNSRDVDNAVMLCAAGVNSKKQIVDACQGDSGGPLIADGSLGPRLVGVVSWGEDCASSYPGVYSRVSALNAFLQGAGALPVSVPTVPPIVSVVPLLGELQVSVTAGDDGTAVTQYAVTAVGRSAGDPSQVETFTCFSAPTKKSVTGNCSISGLITGLEYSVTAISANDQGNSPASAPVIAIPSDQPVAGGIKSVKLPREDCTV